MTEKGPTKHLATVLLLALASACSDESTGAGGTTATTEPPTTEPPTTEPPTADPAGGAAAPASTPDALPNGLLVAASQFVVENGRATATPGPARLDLIWREGGEWRVETLEDATSNVFHKAMVYDPPGEGPPGILTLGGMAAEVNLWRRNAAGEFEAEEVWAANFGGRWNRMRDCEIAPLFGAAPGPGGVVGDALAIATHDQGVVAVASPATAGGFRISELDRRPNTFVHEIEIGDLNGDGTLEIYATPSDPNDLSGTTEQHGEVVRYVVRPDGTAERTVVADLGSRHAKEILVDDVDGDGRDELYVAVEALTRGEGAALEIVEPVEIRRFDEGTPPGGRVVIATLRDRLTRFLTAGDVDGDGRREMIVAAFRSGLWLLRPGRDARGEWSSENIERESSGFEHAALLADLDGDRTDELYVAADEQLELRRYVWVNGRPRREVIRTLGVARSLMTWNLMPFPVETFRRPVGHGAGTGTGAGS
jgi:hypothetical protein